MKTQYTHNHTTNKLSMRVINPFTIFQSYDRYVAVYLS